MQVNLFQNTELKKEHIDVHYKKMSPLIKKVIDISKENNDFTHLSGKTERGQVVFIETKDIYYFETVDKKNFAYLHHKVYEIQRNLSYLEEHLTSQGFVRINKSNVVNIYYIHSIVPEVNMRVKAVLENKECLIINRNYKKNFVKFNLDAALV